MVQGRLRFERSLIVRYEGKAPRSLWCLSFMDLQHFLLLAHAIRSDRMRIF